MFVLTAISIDNFVPGVRVREKGIYYTKNAHRDVSPINSQERREKEETRSTTSQCGLLNLLPSELLSPRGLGQAQTPGSAKQQQRRPRPLRRARLVPRHLLLFCFAPYLSAHNDVPWHTVYQGPGQGTHSRIPTGICLIAIHVELGPREGARGVHPVQECKPHCA